MSASAKFTGLVCLVVGAFIAGYVVNRRPGLVSSSTSTNRVLYYTCPMHPQYKSDRPGDAPCCGMRLEPVYAEGASGGAGSQPGQPLPRIDGAVHVDAERQQMIGVQVEGVRKEAVVTRVRLLGRVAPDDFRVHRIVGLSDGWIRELSEVTVGTIVRKDQVLATFYAPEFLGAQQAYLYALDALGRFQASGNETDSQIKLTKANIQQYYDSLRALGMSDAQIVEIGRTKVTTQDVRLTAPVTGVVISRNIYPNQRFEKNTEFYRIADLSRVWVLADIFERDREFVRPGATATVQYQGGRFAARMSGVLPEFDPASRTLRTRCELDNPGYVLRPGMFVDVELQVNLPASVTVPADALIDSGRRKTVFVDRGNGFFEPRAVETGRRFGDRVEVTRGLDPGERIVVAGNFLLDSESRMRTVASNAAAPAKDPVCGMDVDPVKAKAAGRTSQYQGVTYSFCSDQCKRKFDASPAQYAGGSAGQSKPAQGPVIDPVCGMEVDRADAKAAGRTSQLRGTTYYFCSDHCKKQFDKDPGKYVKKPAGSGHSSGSGEAHI